MVLDDTIHLDLQKTITFKRLPLKHVTGYEIYGEFQDSTYASGIRTELLETFDNPPVPNVSETTIELPYSKNATWTLPYDAYIDRDHTFYLRLINGEISEKLGSMYVSFNRVAKIITLDTVLKDYNINSKVQLTYFQDFITRSYSLADNCNILVKPIFTESYSYGFHNVII